MTTDNLEQQVTVGYLASYHQGTLLAPETSLSKDLHSFQEIHERGKHNSHRVLKYKNGQGACMQNFYLDVLFPAHLYACRYSALAHGPSLDPSQKLSRQHMLTR
jgi:hypothetical protein